MHLTSWTDPATGIVYACVWPPDRPGIVRLVAGPGPDQQEIELPWRALEQFVEGRRLLAEQGVFDA